ncbi:MAG: hypothetical protein H0T78_06005 [Longispora sp.]|nr:hypothetical protein [Longispora sp. (in: high G+C Gram-positive bacteria)]
MFRVKLAVKMSSVALVGILAIPAAAYAGNEEVDMPEPTAPNAFKSLSDEMRVEVFLHLNADELKSVRVVSEEFQRIADDWALWKHNSAQLPARELFRLRKVNPALEDIADDEVARRMPLSSVAGTGDVFPLGQPVPAATDNIPGSDETLAFPMGLATDDAGNTYIAEGGRHQVRRVSPDGTISTVAGSGAYGQEGDGGDALHAQLGGPTDVVLDRAHNLLYIADMTLHLVRCVDLNTGIISTVAGINTPQQVGADDLAVNIALFMPLSIAVDSGGNLFIAELGRNRIRRVDFMTNVITTVAGTGVAGSSDDGINATEANLNAPNGIAVDSEHNILYIADSQNHLVRQVDLSTNVISTVAGTGVRGDGPDGLEALDTALDLCDDVHLDAERRHLYISDTGNHRIRRLDLSTNRMSTVIGTGVAGNSVNGMLPYSTSVQHPAGVVQDHLGNVLFTDIDTQRVWRFLPQL